MLKFLDGVWAGPRLFAMLSLSALAGCGEDKARDPASNATMPSAMPTPAAATSIPAPTPPPSPVVQVPPSCELAAPATCLGPLGVTVENVGLRWGGPPSANGWRRVGAVATVRIESRSDDPVYLALLDQPIRVQFTNGLTLDRNRPGRDVTGLQVCGDTGTECLNRSRDKFASLPKRGESLRLEIAIEQNVPAELAAIAPAAEKASISAALWVISSTPEGESLSLSLAADKINNSTRK
jgi:hypothetical protein